MCSMFVVSLNIATVGYFWWYLPEFESSRFREESLHLGMRVAVDQVL